MDWIQQWQSKLNKQNGVAPLVRTGGSRHTGLAALPYRNIHMRENHMMNGFESMKKTHAAAVDIIQCAKVKNDCHWIF